MKDELAWTQAVCGVVGFAVTAFGCSSHGPLDTPRSNACSSATGGECGGVAITGRPLLFMTANAATNQLALRITHDDGTIALVAQRTSDPPYTSRSWSEYRYDGGRDRRGTFPYMVPASENASVSPDGAWVLWRRDDGSSWDVIDTRDGQVAAIRETNWDEHVLKWSPDGKHFVGLDRDSCTLRVATPAEGRVDEVAGFGAACADQALAAVSAWWAPDGSWIAYLSPGGELHTVRPDGSEPRVVATAVRNCGAGTSSGDYWHSPWSPGGDRLSFVTLASANGDVFQVRSATPDGTDSTVLLEFPVEAFVQGLNEREPLCEWSPDGEHVAIGGPPGVFTVAAHGGDPHTLLGPGVAYDFAWSPDGAHLSVTEYGDGLLRQHTLRFDGENHLSQSTTHPPGSYSSAWSWSKDGVHGLLDIATGDHSEVHLYDAESGSDIVLPDSGDRYAWTRDGARVIYTKKSRSSEAEVGIASVLADGSGERTYPVRAASVPEMTWLGSGDGGDYWCGADRDGLWCQNLATAGRHLIWPSTESDPLIDFALWDHALVWN